MLAIKGVYDGEHIQPLEDIPSHKRGQVIITFIEDEEPIPLKDELTAEQYERLQASRQQVKKGKTVSHEEAMERIKTWVTR